MFEDKKDDWGKLYRAHIDHVQTLYGAEMERAGFDCLVIAAGETKPVFLDDKYYPFKANPHFRYWLPVNNAPASFLVLRPGEKPNLILYQPQDYWEKTEIDTEAFWAPHFSLIQAPTPEKAGQILNGMVTGRAAFIGESDAPGILKGQTFAEINPERLINGLHYRRAIKTAYEMASLRQANRRAVAGHIAARAAFKTGGSEFDVHLAYLAATRHLENELPYQSIIGENENGACLHYRQKSRDRYPAGSLHAMVIDAGAEHNGYIADITRSYAAYGGDFADLIKAMDKAQRKIVAGVAVGVPYERLNEQAHLAIARILADFNIVRLAPEEMVERRISNVFFPHGLGHFIGLQVHDVGGHMKDPSGTLRPAPEKYPSLRLTRTLEAGHAVTIEPGLYFIDMLLAQLRNSSEGKHVDWARIETFRKFGGIRVEDNILVHDNGPENITRDAWG
jgi:Xaa-Pro dipeptidase